MPGERTLTIALDPPIKHAGGEIAELRLREPTGREMREAEGKLSDGVSAEAISNYQASLVSAVAGLSEDAINALRDSINRQAVSYLLTFDRSVRRGPEQPPPSLEIDLPEPVAFGGVTYRSLTLAEPTVGMRRRAETAMRTGQTAANARQYQIILVAEAAGVPFAAVETMPVSALNAAQAYLQGFIEPGPPTGSS